MKIVTVLALSVTVCFLAVNAKAIDELTISNEVETDQHHIINPAEIRCILIEIRKLKIVSEQLIKNIINCPRGVKGKVRDLIDTLRRIIKLIGEIEKLKKSDCKKGVCSIKLWIKIRQLKENVSHAIGLIKEIKDVPKCLARTIRNGAESLIEIRKEIEACKLHTL